MGDDSLEGLKRLARKSSTRPRKSARTRWRGLKEGIDQGTYEIDSAKLADLIIEELLGKR